MTHSEHPKVVSTEKPCTHLGKFLTWEWLGFQRGTWGQRDLIAGCGSAEDAAGSRGSIAKHPDGPLWFVSF